MRTADAGGLPPSMLDAIADVGGLWYAGDYYASTQAILATARDAGVRALRVDARDLSWLGGLPELELLHVRTDGRAPLDPIRSLGSLRGLTVEVGAVRGTIDLRAHPDLRWFKIELSGKGGAAVLPGVLAGHPGIEHVRLAEVPFRDLTEVAAAFPSVRFLALHGAERLKKLGDLTPWSRTLRGLGFTFALRLRALDGIERLEGLDYVGVTYGTLHRVDEIAGLNSPRYLALAATCPSLTPFTGHRALRMARVAMPADENLEPLRSLPSLVALGGAHWIGRPVDGLPSLQDLPAGDSLRLEWQRSAAG